jgi:hypothetical protein
VHRLLLVLTLLLSPAPVTSTPAADALDWVIDASHRVPVATAELQEHLSAQLLNGVGGPDGFNKVLGQLGPLSAGPVLDSRPTHRQQIVSGYVTTIDVDPTGLITGLRFAPYRPAPTSWSQIDAQLRTLAPQVSFTAARIDPGGNCHVTHAVNGDTRRPLGSAFKLYVLSTLARTIQQGRLAWDRTVPLHEAWKSLPSGVLQNQAAGTPYTLRQYADYMISISDNTAADHLIHIVGRDQIERLAPPQNGPFLTTRELFVLKGFQYPDLANGYLYLPQGLRQFVLPALDAVPRDQITPWTQPRQVERIEWFASPADLCRVYAELEKEAVSQPPVAEALSINDGGIGLDRTQFPTVWFKGGSEPGVLTLNYLARHADGATVMTSVLLANPAAPFSENTVTPQAIAIARGALEMA